MDSQLEDGDQLHLEFPFHHLTTQLAVHTYVVGKGGRCDSRNKSSDSLGKVKLHRHDVGSDHRACRSYHRCGVVLISAHRRMRRVDSRRRVDGNERSALKSLTI